MNVRKNIDALIAVMVGLTLAGTAAFHWLEGWGWLDAAYYTVVTLGTVGYGDLHPHTPAGKLACMGFIFLGLGVISYSLIQITSFVVEGHLNKMLRTRRVDAQVRKLKGHFIVCGAGKTGRYVVEELVKNKRPFVIIDKDPQRLAAAQFQDHPHLIADATEDEVLKRAGIDKAHSLAAALDTDELNLFLTLTAKNLNHGVRCVTKCVHESARGKLLKAGADAVVAPNMIGGLRIASEMVRPNVVSFLDVMLREAKGVRFEEATLPKGSPWAGKELGSLKMMERLGMVPIAVRQGGLHFVYNPPPTHVLKADDTLVVIGEPERLTKLRQLLNG